MDLDPGEDVDWDMLVAAACEVRDRLESDGLAAFVKTSGGKGLHVVAPLKPKATWAEAKSYSSRIAGSMAKDAPDLYVATVAKRARAGRIFVDYLRNQRGATAVAAFSTRARAGAPVSVPVAWDELATIGSGARFTVATLPSRLAALKADPWKAIFEVARPLPAIGKQAARK